MPSKTSSIERRPLPLSSNYNQRVLRASFCFGSLAFVGKNCASILRSYSSPSFFASIELSYDISKNSKLLSAYAVICFISYWLTFPCSFLFWFLRPSCSSTLRNFSRISSTSECGLPKLPLAMDLIIFSMSLMLGK